MGEGPCITHSCINCIEHWLWSRNKDEIKGHLYDVWIQRMWCLFKHAVEYMVSMSELERIFSPEKLIGIAVHANTIQSIILPSSFRCPGFNGLQRGARPILFDSWKSIPTSGRHNIASGGPQASSRLSTSRSSKNGPSGRALANVPGRLHGLSRHEHRRNRCCWNAWCRLAGECRQWPSIIHSLTVCLFVHLFCLIEWLRIAQVYNPKE